MAPTLAQAQFMTAGAAFGTLACDGGESSQFLAHANQTGLIETNPILGDHPSDAAVWGYLGAIAVGVAAANKWLPRKWALAVNLAVIGIETHATVNNMSYGTAPCGIGNYDEHAGESWQAEQPTIGHKS